MGFSKIERWLYSASCLLMLLLFSACSNSFEHKFYSGLELGLSSYSVKKKPVLFNLSHFTDFDWEKLIIIYGNESVPVLAEEIEHKIGYKTTDLSLNKDRFYFFKNNQLVKEIEIKSGYYTQAYLIEYCNDSSIVLTKQDCRFKLVANDMTPKKGTIYLYPPCRNIPDILLK